MKSRMKLNEIKTIVQCVSRKKRAMQSWAGENLPQQSLIYIVKV